MPPDQYGYTPPPQQDYNFIMNPEKPKRQLGGSFFNGSPKSLFILLGGVIIVIIILFVVFNALKPKGLTPEIISLAENQQEIARVAGEAAGQASSQAVLNFAASTQASLASEQTQLLAYLAKYGVKPSSNTLALGQNPATDQALKQAESASNFDSVFIQIMNNYLSDYSNQLAAIFAKNKSHTLALQLQADYQASQLLLQQAKDPNLANG